MNFYNIKNIEDVIKHYIKDNNNYVIEYLNGKNVVLKDKDSNYEYVLNKKMLLQAKKRDIEYNNFKTKSKKIFNFFSSIMFLYMINYSIDNNIFLLLIVGFIGLASSLLLSIMNILEKEEIIKYRNFLLIVDDLSNEINKDIVKKYELNNLPLNINNLDSYSNKTIKRLRKELKR